MTKFIPMDSFKIQSSFNLKPEILFKAWLDSTIHGEMTGTDAEIDPKVNGSFSIWNGYITGKTLELVQDKKIVQSWRTTDFPEGSDYSVTEVEFHSIPEGTRLTIWHYNIPEGQGKEYKEGWKKFYFKPMKEYIKEVF
jgi:activator of HSP90 ATPase